LLQLFPVHLCQFLSTNLPINAVNRLFMLVATLLYRVMGTKTHFFSPVSGYFQRPQDRQINPPLNSTVILLRFGNRCRCPSCSLLRSLCPRWLSLP
jgi:hypothetical protein